jgi:citrate lyase beta subunit
MPHDPFLIKQAGGHIKMLARCIAQSRIGKMAIDPAQIESINEILY